jgi:hypothetical protein
VTAGDEGKEVVVVEVATVVVDEATAPGTDGEERRVTKSTTAMITAASAPAPNHSPPRRFVVTRVAKIVGVCAVGSGSVKRVGAVGTDCDGRVVVGVTACTNAIGRPHFGQNRTPERTT